MALKMFQKSVPAHPLSSINHIIAVAAGKGGVGKSSVTVNLALTLKRAGYSVGIMDTDVYGPSIRRMLPEEQLPGKNGDMIIPAISRGIKIISMAHFRKKEEAVAVRAPIANGVISQFIKNVSWGPLDFLLIDFPPGTGDIQLTLSQQANLTGAIMVTTPQEISIMDVRKASHLFNTVNVPIIGVVENMSYYCAPATQEKSYLFGKGGGTKLATEIGVPLLTEIPIDPLICQCGDEGVSLFDRTETSLGREAFEDLGKTVVAHVTALKRSTPNSLGTFSLNWREI